MERGRIVDGRAVKPGDRVLGLASSGLHSNGYSLARRIVFDVLGLDVGATFPGTSRSVADELLEPTRIYATSVKAVLEAASVVIVDRDAAELATAALAGAGETVYALGEVVAGPRGVELAG